MGRILLFIVLMWVLVKLLRKYYPEPKREVKTFDSEQRWLRRGFNGGEIEDLPFEEVKGKTEPNNKRPEDLN